MYIDSYTNTITFFVDKSINGCIIGKFMNYKQKTYLIKFKINNLKSNELIRFAMISSSSDKSTYTYYTGLNESKIN